MTYFTVTKYNDSLYQIKDALGVLATLVIGRDKALLFDTCYGIGDLKKEVESITDKPLIVVNSHGHMDHACGNYQFDSVYIHKDDVELCKKHCGVDRRKRNIESAKRLNVLPDGFDVDKYINEGTGNLKLVDVGDVFDLGNVDLEVIKMEGHTAGSIGLYIKKWKLMLVSDAACPFVWLFLEESLPLSTYVKMLERTLKYDFDNFLVGHGAVMYPKSKMEEFYDVAKNVEMDKIFKVAFDNFQDCNSYCYTRGKLYGVGDCGVIFDPRRL